MQYVPYDLEGGWDETQKEAFAETVISTLEQYAPNIRRAIIGKQVITPVDIERIAGITGGNIFHGELTMDQLLFNRPVPGYAQYRSPVGGLYMCGSSTHPGGGVTGVPGHNAAREILRDFDGLISSGPFACLPTRVIEAILKSRSLFKRFALKKPGADADIVSATGDALQDRRNMGGIVLPVAVRLVRGVPPPTTP